MNKRTTRIDEAMESIRKAPTTQTLIERINKIRAGGGGAASTPAIRATNAKVVGKTLNEAAGLPPDAPDTPANRYRKMVAQWSITPPPKFDRQRLLEHLGASENPLL